MTENEALNILKDLHISFVDIANISCKPEDDNRADALDTAIQALETVQKYKDLESELSKRNLTIDHIREYIQFEDECVEMGFTFDSLLEARGKQIKKKPVVEENEMFHTKYYRCPICGGNIRIHKLLFKYCRTCGQKIKWEGIKNE